MENLLRVYYDNVRINQIGENGGISPQVAKDLGFSDSDDVLRLIRETNEWYIQEIREKSES
ncbi:hypothetical protein M1145_00985 [Patescibacteria group bacterium]|nr:hypothetical protein [Patescibacteria group bacterium]